VSGFVFDNFTPPFAHSARFQKWLFRCRQFEVRFCGTRRLEASAPSGNLNSPDWERWHLAGELMREIPSNEARLCPAAGSVAATWHGRKHWKDFTLLDLRRLLRLVSATQPRSGHGRLPIFVWFCISW
jgi:hypothetical protein